MIINKNFLVVDDQEEICNMQAMILRRNGFKNVYLAHTGKRALGMLKRVPIHFIATDWHMPNMTGIELLIAIRHNPLYQDIPVLMVTEEMSEEKVLYAIEEGVDGYQEKPFTEKNFLKAIDTIFHKRLYRNELEQKLQKLSSLKVQKKYDDALMFGQILLSQHESPEALFILSECYFQKKDYESAKIYAKKALKLKKDSKFMNLLGEIYMAEGKFEKAVEQLKESSSMNPLNLNRKIELGNAYLQLGLLDDASETFSDVKDSAPTDLNYIRMGSAYLNAGDIKKAGEFIKQAVDPLPETIGTFNNYAIELRKLGEVEEAVTQYKKCLSIYPNNYIILYNLGKAYCDMGKYQEAKKVLEKSIASKPIDEVKKFLTHVESKIEGLL